ncbi:hypothetical protein VIOR3934_00455 [Vibrio orientalis CIP 102891 = ATCC 33934]|uniref:Uncharacterized protein n=1 Tax=Vibrio orientalis CIP 102891 = ATCC 33934 TaxID=675816 RepID=F9SSJ0_VIBOR|nr:hypothetical protein VIOR3934_00455 [Vibrio orientalis CIP 102891 = ATCC 33934]
MNKMNTLFKDIVLIQIEVMYMKGYFYDVGGSSAP